MAAITSASNFFLSSPLIAQGRQTMIVVLMLRGVQKQVELLLGRHLAAGHSLGQPPAIQFRALVENGAVQVGDVLGIPGQNEMELVGVDPPVLLSGVGRRQNVLQKIGFLPDLAPSSHHIFAAAFVTV